MEEVDLVPGSTTEWHDNCATHHTVVRYAVTAIDSTGKEHRLGVNPTAPLYLFGSYEPIAEVQYIVSPFAQCCVLCSDTAFNPDEEQYLYVFDCDGDGDGLAEGIYARVLDKNGRLVIDTVALTVPVTTPFVQGCPCAAYNPNTREYLVAFEIKTPQFYTNASMLVSQRLDSLSLQRTFSVFDAMYVRGSGGIRRCNLAFNPKTGGYAIVGEVYFPFYYSKSVLGYIASNGTVEEILVLDAKATSKTPRILYDKKTDSLVLVFLVDRSNCTNNSSICVKFENKKHFIAYRRRSAIPGVRLPRSIRNHIFVVGFTTRSNAQFSTYFQSRNNIDCIGVCYDVNIASGLFTASRCATHCSILNETHWNRVQAPEICHCGVSSTSGVALSFRKDDTTFAAVWEEKRGSGHRLNGHFLNPTHFTRSSQWTDQRSPQVVYNFKSDTVCVFWKYSSGCATCYKSAVRCFTTSAQCTDPCCCSDLPSCEFPCSSCNSNSECLPQKRECKCNRGFVGDGHFCCPKDLGSKTAVVGGSAVLRCDDSCTLERSSHVKWYHNGTFLAHSYYGRFFSTDGRWLSVDPVESRSSGNYTCEILTKTNVYQRHGILHVLRKQDLSYQCDFDCGRSCARQQRIHDGSTVPLGKYPWMGMLCDGNSSVFCGAVLVSCHCVVTAAHCILTSQGRVNEPSDFHICFNKRCRNQCEVPNKEGNDCYRAREIIVHPQYDNETYDNDIAVIKLEGNVESNCSTVSPVCMPYGTSADQDAVQPGASAVVIGWGQKRQGGTGAKCLQEGSVQIVSPSKCRRYYRKGGIASPRGTLCATDDSGACQGDSGGPLLVRNSQNENRWTLAGIVSWGIGCGQQDSYGAYANVPRLSGFLRGACGTI